MFQDLFWIDTVGSVLRFWQVFNERRRITLNGSNDAHCRIEIRPGYNHLSVIHPIPVLTLRYPNEVIVQCSQIQITRIIETRARKHKSIVLGGKFGSIQMTQRFGFKKPLNLGTPSSFFRNTGERFEKSSAARSVRGIVGESGPIVVVFRYFPDVRCSLVEGRGVRCVSGGFGKHERQIRIVVFQQMFVQRLPRSFSTSQFSKEDDACGLGCWGFCPNRRRWSSQCREGVQQERRTCGVWSHKQCCRWRERRGGQITKVKYENGPKQPYYDCFAVHLMVVHPWSAVGSKIMDHGGSKVEMGGKWPSQDHLGNKSQK